MKVSHTPKTVLETILDWSSSCHMWQRDALRRIVVNGRLKETDINELVNLCKNSNPEGNADLKPNPLTNSHLPANPDQSDSVALHYICSVKNTNSLAADQILNFEPNGVTVIYGDNGAGKSGYARILKRACRARHTGEILPNIYAELPLSAKASAEISYSLGGAPQNVEVWQDTDTNNYPHPIFSAINVFDSECASIHLREKNEVAFRPFGLDVPEELANVCQQVKDALSAEKKKLEAERNSVFIRPSWKEFTIVGKSLASLNHNTEINHIKSLATLTEEEYAQFSRLKEDLSKDPAKAVAEQKLKADNINLLKNFVKTIEDQTTDQILLKIFELDHEARTKREVARIAGQKAFSGEALNGVGGEIWRSLWESARCYSSQVAYTEHRFPHALGDALCVLCQQPLSEDAIKRMKGFEEFIQNDTEKQAQIAEMKSKENLQKLRSLKINTLFVKASLQEITLQNQKLARCVRRFIALARLRRYIIVKNLGSASQPILPAIVTSPIVMLEQREVEIRVYSAELQKSAGGEGRKKLELDLAELTDRVILNNMLQTVEDEVSRFKKIQFLTECISTTTTNAITKIGNDIADTIVTPKLRDRFQEEIVKLAAEKVRVEMVRSGGKYGSPQYQIRLFVKPEANVSTVLSEGEQTCVALAGFLTELATATHNSALIFDDPVNSLDHRWRKQVAKRLVEESSKRQVIVFTHDLVFVNDLMDITKERKQPIKPVTISRGAEGAGIVTEGLPWIVKSIEDRLDNLEKRLTKAKRLYDSNEEKKYAEEATAIYNELRATWERALEDVAFGKVILRHRDYINAKELKKVSVLNETDCDQYAKGFKKCCGIVDAHDLSRGRNDPPPAPAEIKDDIESLKAWTSSLRGRQKLLQSSD